MSLDAISFARDLIRAESVTPDSGAALDVLEAVLSDAGFTCHRLLFSEDGTPDVPNLYARYGSGTPNICFAGHTDVVPTGLAEHWSSPPFAAEVVDGQLYGRGAADMKAAIASFTSAATNLITDQPDFSGSISFLITGDEEGPAINGTKKVLQWLRERGETIDYCLVGEPTNPEALGDMIKIGRRGSLHGFITTQGIQGHVAYPHHAHNPIPDMVRLLAALEAPLDDGNEHFQPSNLEIVDMQVGNDSHNVIPGEATARFNVRFNSNWTPEALQAALEERLADTGVERYSLKWWLSGDSFITEPCRLTDALVAAVEAHTGRTPALSTSGGTSDARFIKDICPVVEFGLIGATMHKVDEHVPVDAVHTLTRIYRDFLDRMLGL